MIELLQKIQLEERVLVALLALTAGMIYYNTFLMDDAYISYVYARNFSEGNGLVWEAGSSEYGYTSFLFTLMLGILMKLGIGIPAVSYIITIPAALLGIIASYKIGRLISPSPVVALLGCAALASNISYAEFATGGLETAFSLALVLWAYYWGFRWIETKSQTQAWISSLTAIALLVRLDNAVLLLPLYLFMEFSLWQRYREGQLHFVQLLETSVKLVAIPVVTVICLFVFCLIYYGQILPNTAYAKATGWHVLDGIHYVYVFIKAQYFMPVALIFLWYVVVTKADFNWSRWYFRFALLGAIGCWLIYLLKVGGDFMEFRFILPMLPFFYLLMFDLILDSGRREKKIVVIAAASMALAGNIAQPRYFDANSMGEYFIESTYLLNWWVAEPNVNWTVVGSKLHKLFYSGSNGDVKIAVTGAGAIPYYSRLPSIDIFGLNTRAALKQTEEFQDRPGHRNKANLNFLVNKGVNLIIDHPLYIREHAIPSGGKAYQCVWPSFWRTHWGLWKLPTIYIPFGEGYYLLAHYLRPHPDIEQYLKTDILLTEKFVKPRIICNFTDNSEVSNWFKSP